MPSPPSIVKNVSPFCQFKIPLLYACVSMHKLEQTNHAPALQYYTDALSRA